MKSIQRSFVAVAALAVLTGLAGAARADDITPDPYQHMVSTGSRAQVVAERDATRAAGEMSLFNGEDSGALHLAQQRHYSVLTRAQVRSEVLEARRSGLLGATSGEDSGSFVMARYGWAQPGGADTRFAAVKR